MVVSSAMLVATLALVAAPTVPSPGTSTSTSSGAGAGAAASGAPFGVMRLVRGAVSLRAGNRIAPGRSGALLAAVVEVQTEADGWTEVQVLAAGRVRLFAATRATFAREGEAVRVRLETGRAWVERDAGPRSLELETPNATATVEPRSAVVLEFTRAAGTMLAARVGAATLAGAPGGSGAQSVAVTAGRIAAVPPDAAASSAARPGGEDLVNVASLASKTALGDLVGLKAFLLDRVGRAQVRGFTPRGVQQIIRTDPEILGSDAGPAGAAIEGGLRPPPFFENEVPPRGPNIDVKVTYGR